MSKQLKILLFSSLFPHRGEPTLGVFVENRLRHLIADEKVQATVVAPVPWFPFRNKIFGKYARAAMAPQKEVRHGITIYHPRYIVIPKFGMMLTPRFMAWSAIRCIKALVKQGLEFDVIDAHYLFPDGVAASAISKAFNRPFIVTARGSDVTEIGLIKGPRALIKQAASSAAHVITVSNNLKRDLIAMEVEERAITTLRNGVDLERFKETDRSTSRRALPNGQIMLFAGWLIPRKRLDLVLQVTAQIDGLVTLIVGDGPLRPTLEAKSKALGIESRVIFWGQKSPDEMPGVFSCADVLLLPSDREGWANVLLESMACGTPVVTRAVGGAPDLITREVAGRVVDSDRAEDIALAVESVLQQKAPRLQVRQFAEGYDWRSTSAGQKKIFEKTLEDFSSSKEDT